jgi:hypothetical protein
MMYGCLGILRIKENAREFRSQLRQGATDSQPLLSEIESRELLLLVKLRRRDGGKRGPSSGILQEEEGCGGDSMSVRMGELR